MPQFDKKEWKKYYVNNSQVLALIDTWKDALPNKKQSIEDLLIKRLSYLVCTKIRHYRGRPFYGDLLQEGKLGLIRALCDFDSARGPNFFKFAVWHVQSRIRNFLKWYKKIDKNIPEDKLYKSCSESVNPYEEYEKYQTNKLLCEAIGQLPKIDQSVLLMRYGIGGYDPCTLQQIGDRFFLTRQRIAQIQSRALLKLEKNRVLKELCDM